MKPHLRNTQYAISPYFPLFITALLLILCPLTASAAPPPFESADCPFTIPAGETIDCGYLAVPENRARLNGRTIQIGVAIVRSHSSEPAPDPIIYLRGGLGQPTRWFIERELSQVKSWLAQRDLILFDQRGLGWSQPVLDCPEIQESFRQKLLGASLTLEEELAPRLVCRDRWLAQGIDIAAYNAFETATDVADLRQALGYEQVNLIGASYWTIVAQLVMRDYGNTGHLRSVVLDSPVPLTVPAMADTPAQLAASMDRLFQDCEADLLCRAAYPDLETVYERVIERLKAAPVKLTGVNPVDGTSFSFPFEIGDFGYLVQYGSYRKLPALIYNIYDGDYTEVITGRETFIRDLSRTNVGEHFGLRTTMNCNEPWQTISPEQRAAMAVYLEAIFMDNPLDIALCQQWPAFESGDQTLAAGDVPTLVFTAEYDTRLPVAYAELIVSRLSRGYHFHVPGAYHANLSAAGPCPELMILEFFDNPTHAPAGRCLATAGPSPFDTRFVIRAAAARRPVQLVMGLLGAGVVALIIAGSLKLRQFRQSGLPLGLTWRHTLRLIGWLSPLGSILLIGLAYAAGQTQFLPTDPANAIAVILPIVIATQAAILFSPEDEPALEVVLATPRPPAWTLLERWLVLLTVQGLIGVGASLLLSQATGHSLAVTLSRWLPGVFCLSGLALFVTVATQRAIFGILVTGLVWLALALFGDFMIDHWPVTWPFHLYLSPGQPGYLLNRLFISLLGLALTGLAAGRLLSDPERLLLGRPRARQPRRSLVTGGAAAPAVLKLVEPQFHPWRLVLIQLLAMIRYEFLLQWRRATLPALVVGLAMTPVIGALIAYPGFQGYRAALANGTLALDVAKAEITANMTPVIWLGLFLIATLLVPLIVADTIPKDQQLGVRELLEALPLSPGVYLAGKLLSLWLSLLAAIALVALASGLVWWLGIGPFYLGFFLKLWGIGGALLILINASLSMLLAAGQPTNRRAILVGAAYALLCLAGLAFIVPAITRPGWWHWLNPARPAVVLYYLLGFPGAIDRSDSWTRAGVEAIQQAANWEAVLGSLSMGLVQVGLVWLIVWQWWVRRRR